MRSGSARLLAASALVAGLACSSKAPIETTSPGPRMRDVMVLFTKVETPDSIGPRQVLVVRRSGMVGPTGCYSFDRFEGRRSDTTVEITGHGVERLDAVCPAVPVDFGTLSMEFSLRSSRGRST